MYGNEVQKKVTVNIKVFQLLFSALHFFSRSFGFSKFYIKGTMNSNNLAKVVISFDSFEIFMLKVKFTVASFPFLPSNWVAEIFKINYKSLLSYKS